MHKRGLSNIISVVLIILIVIVSIILVWSVVKTVTTSKSKEIDINQFSTGLSTQVVDLTNNPVLIPVTRDAGSGELASIKIVFKNSDGDSYVYENSTSLPKSLETVIYSINISSGFLPVSFEVYPIVKTSSGGNIAGIPASGGGGGSGGGSAVSPVAPSPGQCIPDCTGKSCGPDGCGGVCGSCSDGYVCNLSRACKIDWCNGADFSRDGFVDGSDLGLYYTNLGNAVCNSSNSTSRPFKPWCNYVDANRDGKVNSSDLAIYQANYDPIGINVCEAEDIDTMCRPKTCSDFGYECGSWSDGCRENCCFYCGNCMLKHTINCGSCSENNLCKWDTGKCVARADYYSYADVLLVCNPASPDSVEICNYFLQKRTGKGFNQAHMVNLAGISISEQVSYSEYIKIKEQIQTFLNSTDDIINYIVTTKGVPLRTENRSVDSKLVVALSPEAVSYFRQESRFAHAQYGSYLVTRLTGASVQDAKNLIDNSDKALMSGNVLINCYKCGENHGGVNINDHHCSSAASVISDKGYSVEYNNSGFITGRNNLSGYISWGSNACPPVNLGGSCSDWNSQSNPAANSSAWNLSFNPGAIGETYVSWSGRTFNYYPWYPYINAQSLVSDLIHMNITGVKGYVIEPTLDAVAHADILFDRYLSGYNLADSFYMASSERDWMDVVIGDPKTVVAK